jgi:CHAT domain-containing protein
MTTMISKMLEKIASLKILDNPNKTTTTNTISNLKIIMPNKSKKTKIITTITISRRLKVILKTTRKKVTKMITISRISINPNRKPNYGKKS